MRFLSQLFLFTDITDYVFVTYVFLTNFYETEISLVLFTASESHFLYTFFGCVRSENRVSEV